MQFDEKVLAALDVLTEAAENNFELYRICALVRDLIAPPAVEQVDDFHQKFNGVTYHKDKSGHYDRWMSLHQSVFKYYNGDIPKGFEVHHDDWNPSNNAPDNLVALTKSEHHRIHCKANAKSMHSKSIATPVATFTCAQCGKEFKAHDNGTNLYCSITCREAARLQRDGELVTCEYCGKEFVGLKKDHRRFCSRKCSWLSKTKPVEQRIPRESYREERTCVYCGKKFSVYKYDETKCCSCSCAQKLRRAQSTEENGNDAGVDD